MATNFEFYKERIIEIVSNDDLAVSKDGAMGLCNDIDCENCIFYREEGGTCKIPEEIMEFLYAEHIEQPKLTKRERAFCEAVQTGWIARDKSGRIYWRDNEPERKKGSLESCWYGHTIAIPLHTLIGDCFSFVKWEDETPWSVADILKLDVIEVQHETD